LRDAQIVKERFIPYALPRFVDALQYYQEPLTRLQRVDKVGRDIEVCMSSKEDLKMPVYP
jgi:hypothetical protein